MSSGRHHWCRISLQSLLYNRTFDIQVDMKNQHNNKNSLDLHGIFIGQNRDVARAMYQGVLDTEKSFLLVKRRNLENLNILGCVQHLLPPT